MREYAGTDENEAQKIVNRFDAATKTLCEAEKNEPTQKEIKKKNNELYFRNRGLDF